MRCSTGRTRFSRCTLLALALAVLAGAACERKRGDRAPPSAKPISPAVVEPLPAPRGQPRVPAPTAPARAREPSSPAVSPSPGTTPSPEIDAGARRDAGGAGGD